MASEFRRAKRARLLVGHIGLTASHLIDEYEFESLADFEVALAGMGAPQFAEGRLSAAAPASAAC